MKRVRTFAFFFAILAGAAVTAGVLSAAFAAGHSMTAP